MIHVFVEIPNGEESKLIHAVKNERKTYVCDPIVRQEEQHSSNNFFCVVDSCSDAA